MFLRRQNVLNSSNPTVCVVWVTYSAIRYYWQISLQAQAYRKCSLRSQKY